MRIGRKVQRLRGSVVCLPCQGESDKVRWRNRYLMDVRRSRLRSDRDEKLPKLRCRRQALLVCQRDPGHACHVAQRSRRHAENRQIRPCDNACQRDAVKVHNSRRRVALADVAVAECVPGRASVSESRRRPARGNRRTRGIVAEAEARSGRQGVRELAKGRRSRRRRVRRL